MADKTDATSYISIHNPGSILIINFGWDIKIKFGEAISMNLFVQVPQII